MEDSTQQQSGPAISAEAVEGWGVAYGSDVYVMSESAAREASQDGELVRKIGGEWLEVKP